MRCGNDGRYESRYFYAPPDRSGKSSSGGVAAFINTVDGCEQMCFTFDATKHEMTKDRIGDLVQDFPSHKYTETNLALGHMWFTWATHGLFIGARRLLLNFQVDDWFIASDRWSPTGNGKNVRLSGKDCQVAVSNMHKYVGIFFDNVPVYPFLFSASFHLSTDLKYRQGACPGLFDT